jgi:hypothetical protein
MSNRLSMPLNEQIAQLRHLAAKMPSGAQQAHRELFEKVIAAHQIGRPRQIPNRPTITRLS